MRRSCVVISIIFLLIICGCMLLAQIVPYGRNHTNPSIVKEPNWDGPQTRELAKRACFDCHSNETVWMWYSNIAPFSWLIQRDVDEGRARLNFSNWQGKIGERSGEGADRISRIIAEGEMPPLQYLLTHPNAKLTQAEKQQLINGLNASLK